MTHKSKASANERISSPKMDIEVPSKLPMRIAEVMHSRAYNRGLLQTREGDVYLYKDGVYEIRGKDTLQTDVWRFLDRCFSKNEHGQKCPIDARKNKVGEVLDALKAISIKEDARLGKWLEGPQINVLNMRNGLLDLSERKLQSHSNNFFTMTQLPYEFDPDARCPRFEKFVSEIFDDDQEMIWRLQEIFGYLVSGDTRLQKWFFIGGAPRSGKGTLVRIVTSILGHQNVSSVTLDQMGQTFGLQGSIGKSLMTIPDAQDPVRRGAVVERILSIVGEDDVSIQRKHLKDIIGPMTARILMAGNRLPMLQETSTALIKRLVIVETTGSWFGREDHFLYDRLMKELPGILNWSLDGYDRLCRENRFTDVARLNAANREALELSSPISVFIEEHIDFDDRNAWIETSELLNAYVT